MLPALNRIWHSRRSPGLTGQVALEPTHLSTLASLCIGYRMTIWTHRVHFLEEQVLPHWKSFTIWNAGKQGRKLYRSLTAASRHKVALFPPYPFGHYSASPSAATSLSCSPHHHLTAGPCSPQVVAFCDVDENKIRKGFYCHEDSQVCSHVAECQSPLQGRVFHTMPTFPYTHLGSAQEM